MVRTKAKPEPATEQLSMLTEQAIGHASAAPWSALIEPISDNAAVAPVYVEPAHNRGMFGAWLVQQQAHRLEWVAGLAHAAKADPCFPKHGSVVDVRKYLTGQGADGDAFEALDDAEMDWLSL